MLRLLEQQVIDPETESHYAEHESMKHLSGTPHDHDFYEIFYIETGSITHCVADQWISLAEGDLVFVRPSDRHTFREWKECRLLNLAFPARVMESLLVYLNAGERAFELLAISAPPTTQVPVYEREELVRGFRILNAIPAHEKSHIRLASCLIVANLLTRWFLLKRPPALQPNAPSLLGELVAAMDEPAQFTRGVPRMKELSPYSYEHLCRLFRRTYNQTPSEWINRRKIEYAANLLQQTDLAIVDLASEAGFDNLSYFYRLFKRRFGLSPNQYREERNRSLIP